MAQMESEMDRINKLPPDEQVQAYRQLASHYREMSNRACSDGARITFSETSREMERLANAVLVFAC